MIIMKKLVFSLIAILISLSSFSQDNERNNIIKYKLNFFTTEFGYERGFKRDPHLLSYDMAFGFFNTKIMGRNDNPQLYNLRFGVKKYMNKNKTPFTGLFFKNEFFGQYAYKIYDEYDRELMDYYTFAYNFSIGYQFLFFKRISLEMNLGAGIAYSNFTDSSHGWLYYDFGIVDSFGVRYGIWKRGNTAFSPCIVGAIKIGYHF